MNFQNLKDFLDSMVSTNRTPGCAVTVYKDGKRVYEYAAGVSDIETGKKLTGEEHFCIYSCSKVTAATAGIQLIEKGILDPNAPLYDYIPEYRHMAIRTENGIEEAKNPITVGDLFSMSAGFDYDFNGIGFQEALKLTNGNCDTDVFARCMSKSVLYFEPGTHWKYSLCHDVLGGLISIITGKKYRDYVEENIFAPLGITNTVFHITPEILENSASQYIFVPDDKDEQNMNAIEAQMHGKASSGTFKDVGKGISPLAVGQIYPEFDSAGGGLISTVGEYAKLMCALSCGGLGANGERILSSHGVELMKTNRLNDTQLADFATGRFLGYGYGMGVRTHLDKAKSGSIANLGEFGWGGAAGSTAIIDSEEKLGLFFVQHTLNPREEWYQPRLRNVIYSCFD